MKVSFRVAGLALVMALAGSCKPAMEQSELVISRVPPNEPGGEIRLNVRAKNVKLGDLIQGLETAIGVEMDGLPSAEAKGNITVSLENVEWRPALKVMLDVMDLAFLESPGRVHIMTKDEYAALPPVTNSYRITHSNHAEAVHYALRALRKLESVSGQELAASDSVNIAFHPSKAEDVKDLIDSVNRRTIPFVYPRPAWPSQFPADIVELRPGTPMFGDLESETVFLEHVSAARVLNRLLPYLDAANGEKLVEFEAANAVVILAFPANLDRLRRLSEYLDDPRWLTGATAAARDP